jgi:hypothetical protein
VDTGLNVLIGDANSSFLLRNVAQRLEHFAAHFRQQGSVEQALRIESWLNSEISLESGSLLPIKQKLAPRLNSWPETKAVMMPEKKTRAKRAGDKAYGAGETSGKKAKILPTAVSVERQVAVTQAAAPVNIVKPVGAVPLTSAFQPLQPPLVDSQPPSRYYRPKTHLY